MSQLCSSPDTVSIWAFNPDSRRKSKFVLKLFVEEVGVLFDSLERSCTGNEERNVDDDATTFGLGILL
jgi:hypothetical protein